MEIEAQVVSSQTTSILCTLCKKGDTENAERFAQSGDARKFILLRWESHAHTLENVYNQEPNEQNKTGAVLDFEICGQQEEYVVFEREAREFQSYHIFMFQ